MPKIITCWNIYHSLVTSYNDIDRL